MSRAATTERRLSTAPPRILVADDDRDTVDMLTMILRDEGYVVHPVYAGKDVLVSARLVRPDAVVMDIALPGLSGYAIANALRHSFTDLRRPLLIAISGVWHETPDRLVGQQVGFDHHLAKPCDPAELLRLLSPLRQGLQP
jgi:DNA-binding response OmpR family regulator